MTNLALKNRRKAAAKWLKLLIPSEDDEWTWRRDGAATAGRYSSLWQTGGNQVRLFIDNRNGRFIALRLETTTAIPGD